MFYAIIITLVNTSLIIRAAPDETIETKHTIESTTSNTGRHIGNDKKNNATKEELHNTDEQRLTMNYLYTNFLCTIIEDLSIEQVATYLDDRIKDLDNALISKATSPFFKNEEERSIYYETVKTVINGKQTASDFYHIVTNISKEGKISQSQIVPKQDMSKEVEAMFDTFILKFIRFEAISNDLDVIFHAWFSTFLK